MWEKKLNVECKLKKMLRWILIFSDLKIFNEHFYHKKYEKEKEEVPSCTVGSPSFWLKEKSF